ncbi:MAG: hypothetical protein U9R19_07435, partial [Bacteroidota bacterium]|nr:hypothetical protein [Bacteroidota bacterium]
PVSNVSSTADADTWHQGTKIANFSIMTDAYARQQNCMGTYGDVCGKDAAICDKTTWSNGNEEMIMK